MTLRTIAANALKGYYTTETGALNKAAANDILSTNTRNDVFSGEEIRDLHAAMVRTGIEELNRKVVLANRPVQCPVASFDPKVSLAAVQETARNLLADLIMNGDIVSYDEAVRNGEGGKRILDLLGKNLDTFVDIVTDLDNALAGFAEPMRSTLIGRFKEMTAGLSDASGANMFAEASMKPVYKAAFTVMLEVSSLSEAERAQAVQSKIKANKALQAAIFTGKITAEDISGANSWGLRGLSKLSYFANIVSYLVLSGK